MGNLVGYKFLDDKKTIRSSDRLTMNKGETEKKFISRCQSLGYEAVDKRNIIDRYKHMNDELIMGDLNKRRFNFSILLQNLSGDYNKAVAIRNNNAFCGQEVIIFGDKRWDKRGACGMHVYENLSHVRTVNELDGVLDEFDYVIGIDNVGNSKSITDYKFDTAARTLFIFGEEGTGVSLDLLERCDDILYIPQFGAVRSINVSCASSIVMYEYTKQAM
jgi:tRNA G18 (ribose-2'-O)-methylase SpoU